MCPCYKMVSGLCDGRLNKVINTYDIKKINSIEKRALTTWTQADIFFMQITGGVVRRLNLGSNRTCYTTRCLLTDLNRTRDLFRGLSNVLKNASQISTQHRIM